MAKDFAFNPSPKKVDPPRARSEEVVEHLRSKGFKVKPSKYPGVTEKSKRYEITHPEHKGESASLESYGGKYASTHVKEDVRVGLTDGKPDKLPDWPPKRSPLVDKAHFALADKFDVVRGREDVRPDGSYVHPKNKYWAR